MLYTRLRPRGISTLRLQVYLACLLVLLNSQMAVASVITWNTANTTGLWNTGADWVGGVAPGSGDVARIDNEVGLHAVTVTISDGGVLGVGASVTAGGLVISSDDALNITATSGAGGGRSLTISGSATSLSNAGTITITAMAQTPRPWPSAPARRLPTRAA